MKMRRRLSGSEICFKAVSQICRTVDDVENQRDEKPEMIKTNESKWRSFMIIICSIAVFCYTIIDVIIPRVVFYIGTGTVLVQPYEWYSADAAAIRNFPHLFDNGQLNEQALAELNTVTCPVHQPRNLSAPAIDPTKVDQSVDQTIYVVVDTKHWGLFPFIWDSILINNHSDPILCDQKHLTKCHRCEYDESNPDHVPSHCRKYLTRHSTNLIVVNHPIHPALLPNITKLLVIGAHLSPPVFEYLHTQALNPDLAVGIVMLSGEECWNKIPSFQSIRNITRFDLNFIAMTYGDCHLDNHYMELNTFSSLPSISQIDLAQPLVPWPLGASCEHGFPSSVRQMDIPPVSSRSVLLNLMVTYSPGKPTRMQALLSATEYCDSHPTIRCVTENNDLLFKAAEAIDSKTGLHLSEMEGIAAPGANLYLPLLLDSVFTLCPLGKNPEQYRIWEAIVAGSIPIIEWPKPSSQTNNASFSVHPSYGTNYRCVPTDIHRVLKKYQAPVIYIEDWRQLPALLETMTVPELQRRQEQLLTWFQGLGQQLQAELMLRFRVSKPSRPWITHEVHASE